MRLKGFTIIEGIVSMVLISLLLSFVTIISFRLYTSFPSSQEIEMKGILKAQMDSLIRYHDPIEQIYQVGTYTVDCTTEPLDDWSNCGTLICSISDNTGSIKFTDKQVFYVAEED